MEMTGRRKELPDAVAAMFDDVSKWEESADRAGGRLVDTPGYDDRHMKVRNNKTLKEFETVSDKVDEYGQPIKNSPSASNDIASTEVVTENQPTHVDEPNGDISELLKEFDIDSVVNEDLSLEIPEVAPLAEVEQVVIPETVMEEVLQEIPEVPDVPEIPLIDGHDISYWHGRFSTVNGVIKKQAEEMKSLKESLDLAANDLSELKKNNRILKANLPVTTKDLTDAGFSEDEIYENGDSIRRQFRQQRSNQLDMEDLKEENQRQIDAMKTQFSEKPADINLEEQARAEQEHQLFLQVDGNAPGFIACNSKETPSWVAFLLSEFTQGFTWRDQAEAAIKNLDAHELTKIYKNYLYKESQSKLTKQAAVKTVSAPIASQQVQQAATQQTVETPIKASTINFLQQELQNVRDSQYSHDQLTKMWASAKSKMARGLVIQDVAS